jgi:hypothetical protein
MLQFGCLALPVILVLWAGIYYHSLLLIAVAIAVLAFKIVVLSKLQTSSAESGEIHEN